MLELVEPPDDTATECHTDARDDERPPEGERHTVDERFADPEESGQQRTANHPHERLVRPEPHPRRDACTDLPGTPHRRHGQQHGPPGLFNQRGADRDEPLVRADHDERQEEPAEDELGDGPTVREQPRGSGADGNGDEAGDGHQDAK